MRIEDGMKTPAAAIRSIRSLGYATAGEADSWRLIGQDGGQSVALKDGRSLFLFSDTLLAPMQHSAVSNRGIFLGNCAALSSAEAKPLTAAMAALHYIQNEQNQPREILPGSDAERALGMRFWPEHGIQIGEAVFFFYLGIRQASPGTWGFVEVGNGLAKLDLRTGTCSRWMCDGDWRPWPMLPSDCHCGVQLLEQNGLVYIFCSRPAGLEHEAFLARVQSDALEEPEAYSFFAGKDRWSQRLTEALPLTRCGSEFSVAYNRYLNCYVMTYVEAHLKQLCLRTAPEPWGPYSEPLRAGVVPHREEAKLVSLGFQHPQFDLNNGRTIFISYSQPHFAQNAMIELNFV